MGLSECKVKKTKRVSEYCETIMRIIYEEHKKTAKY